MDLFTNYQFDNAHDVLQPKYVRKSLEELFKTDFGEGKMGCAQETLTDILAYLHRESQNPNYLEEYFMLQTVADSDVDEKAD